MLLYALVRAISGRSTTQTAEVMVDRKKDYGHSHSCKHAVNG